MACPPLQGAAAHHGARPATRGAASIDPAFRALFTRESVLASDWYAARLAAKQRHDIQLWRNHATYLENFLKKKNYAEEAQRLGIREKLEPPGKPTTRSRPLII